MCSFWGQNLAKDQKTERRNLKYQPRLVSIAKDVPVLALSQLSRAVELREDKRPNLADLREFRSTEQDADVVMFVYREEYYLNKREPERKVNGVRKIAITLDMMSGYPACNPLKTKLRSLVAKQRHGPTGAVQCISKSTLRTLLT